MTLAPTRLRPADLLHVTDRFADDVEWVVLCSQGYTSSLAAASLKDLGLRRATDVVGGYHALKSVLV